MKQNLKFLTEINGIYNHLGYTNEDFNYLYNLIIFIDDKKDIIKICGYLKYFNNNDYTKLEYLNSVNSFEILIYKDDNFNIFNYLMELYEENLKIFKKIIFNYFLDKLDQNLAFEEIY